MLDSEKKLYAEYTYKCDKHLDCKYEFRIRYAGTTATWVPYERGEHSEDHTSVQLKRGINPLFLELIDSENERNTPPKTILKLIRERDWKDGVTFPTPLQISNRKQHLATKVQGPLTQYKYAVNLIKWVNDNKLRTKDQYENLHDDQYFTMGYVEYIKNTVNGPLPAFAFGYTTKGNTCMMKKSIA